jgi:hypothetical protein
MKKKMIVLTLVLLLTLALATPVLAHSAPPCNDSDGDGSPSGREYAAHHIVPLATMGELGAGGHVPGSHHGFSLCNPSGK